MKMQESERDQLIMQDPFGGEVGVNLVFWERRAYHLERRVNLSLGLECRG